MSSEDISSLRKAIKAVDDGKAWHTGTLPVPADELTLFYRDHNGGAQVICFSNATQTEIDALAKACEPATFGKGDVEMLDESYRKAGKLDRDKFAWNFNPERNGVLDTVKQNLFGPGDTRGVSAELYKLNVYGKNSFFKKHVDTPRGDTMFGTLVLVLPSAHQGGGFALRHNGKEFILDSSGIFKSAANSSTMAFAAFYSDVEHEVLPVTNGLRVTVTYNLYFTDQKTTAGPPVSDEVVKDLVYEVERAIETHTFAEGGMLGFSLSYSYPISEGDKSLNHLLPNLKGKDAVIASACAKLGLECFLGLIYEIEDSGTILAPKPVNIHWQTEDLFEDVLYNTKGIVVELHEDYRTSSKNKPQKVTWVNEIGERSQIPDSVTGLNSPVIFYGNEASLGHLYGKVFLIAKVKPFEI